MKRIGFGAIVLGCVIASMAISISDRVFKSRNATARDALNDGVLRAVVIGDSVARGAGDERRRGIAGALDDQLRALHIRGTGTLNLGINGARTRDVQRLLSRTAARSAIRTADVVVLSIGGNDLYGDSIARVLSTCFADRQQARALARVQRVVTTLRRVNPAARIYLLGLYNPYRKSRAGSWLDRQVNRWDARLIARFAGNRDVTVIRICDLLQRDDRLSAIDHFHPGAAGYVAIAARIASSM